MCGVWCVYLCWFGGPRVGWWFVVVIVCTCLCCLRWFVLFGAVLRVWSVVSCCVIVLV